VAASPTQRRNLNRQITTLYAWIATHDGVESIVTVDIASPGGIGSRAFRLIAPRKPEAMRYATLARRYLENATADGSPVARVDLRTFTSAGNGRPAATLRAPAARKV
jgi:hypothetical protein